MLEDRDINEWKVRITYSPETVQVLECYPQIKNLFMEARDTLEQIKGRFLPEYANHYFEITEKALAYCLRAKNIAKNLLIDSAKTTIDKIIILELCEDMLSNISKLRNEFIAPYIPITNPVEEL